MGTRLVDQPVYPRAIHSRLSCLCIAAFSIVSILYGVKTLAESEPSYRQHKAQQLSYGDCDYTLIGKELCGP